MCIRDRCEGEHGAHRRQRRQLVNRSVKSQASTLQQESCKYTCCVLATHRAEGFSRSVSSLKHIFNELKYELTNKLAEGGMGLVYEAVQKGTGNFRKTVAIKLIREEYSSIPEFQKNFIGEARLVADLIHTNIVQTYHLGQIGGQYFMTMEFVSGVNLEQFIERHTELGRQVPLDIAVFIASRVCRGLSYAHSKRDKEGRLLGIVHRDVNPKNVMLAIEGDVKLTDFGIAKALDLMYNEEGKIIHVGMILKDKKIIHSSAMVRIDTFDHFGIFNADLNKYSHQLKIIKRVL